MKKYEISIPTTQELTKTVNAMTVSQKLQFEAIIDAVTALLACVQQPQKNEQR